jgi:hypothetical protein
MCWREHRNRLPRRLQNHLNESGITALATIVKIHSAAAGPSAAHEVRLAPRKGLSKRVKCVTADPPPVKQNGHAVVHIRVRVGHNSR